MDLVRGCVRVVRFLQYPSDTLRQTVADINVLVRRIMCWWMVLVLVGGGDQVAAAAAVAVAAAADCGCGCGSCRGC